METLNTLMAELKTEDEAVKTADDSGGEGNVTADTEVGPLSRSGMQYEEVFGKESRCMMMRNLKRPRPLHPSTILEFE